MSKEPINDDLVQLTHDLRVHQAELELQAHELRESNVRLDLAGRRFQQLFEVLPQSALVTDRFGAVHSANREAERLLGACSDESRRTMLPLLGSDGGAISRLRAVFAVAVREGAAQEREVELLGADGQALLVDIEIARVDKIEPDGDDRFIVLVTDGTAHRAEQEQLRLLAAAVATIHEIVLITDAELTDDPGPRIVFVNDAFERRTGFLREDVIGRSPRLLEGPDTDRGELDRIQTARERRESVTAELLNYGRDGRSYWVEVATVPISDDSGLVTHFVAVERDVSERRRAEERTRQALRLEALGRGLLERSEHALRETQRMAGLGSWELDIDTDQVMWSDELFDLFGLDAAHSLPSFADQAPFYGAESWERLTDAVEATKRTGDPYLVEGEIVRADGSLRWAQIRGEAVRDDGGSIVGLRGFVLDITDRKKVERALAASEALFRTAMLASPIGMAMTTLDGSFRIVNKALRDLLDRDEAWLTSHGIDDVTHPDDLKRRRHDDRHALIAGEAIDELEQARLIRSDDRVLWVRQAAELIPGASGEPDHLLVQYVDTTKEHVAVEELTYRAFHDPLTGRHNRESILEGLEVDLLEAQRAGHHVGVLFIDLDNFKIVNDSLGHAAGDEVLMTVATRIGDALRPSDRLGRSGGDEFIAVVPYDADGHQVERVAERIVSAVATELMIRGHRIVPTVSIGVALSGPDSTGSSLVRDADAALFSAKEAGRSRWKLFDAAMHAQALFRLTTEDEMRRGLAAGEFVVHYQPIVALDDRRVVGHEALVRWTHPDQGLLTPTHFLPTAEDSGLVIEIGQHALDQVCKLLASSGHPPGSISINYSPVQLASAGWLQAFIDTVSRHDVDPRHLVVEVTETAVMSLLPGTRDDLLALRSRGVGLHVDDFGTGFSSISLLRDMPVTGLKLDASFVADLSDDIDAASALSTGLAGLVNGLHLDGIAEGVETEEQHRILLSHGWSHAQGYLYGRPGPVPAVTAQSDR